MILVERQIDIWRRFWKKKNLYEKKTENKFDLPSFCPFKGNKNCKAVLLMRNLYILMENSMCNAVESRLVLKWKEK